MDGRSHAASGGFVWARLSRTVIRSTKITRDLLFLGTDVRAVDSHDGGKNGEHYPTEANFPAERCANRAPARRTSDLVMVRTTRIGSLTYLFHTPLTLTDGTEAVVLVPPQCRPEHAWRME